MTQPVEQLAERPEEQPAEQLVEQPEEEPEEQLAEIHRHLVQDHPRNMMDIPAAVEDDDEFKSFSTRSQANQHQGTQEV